EKRFSHGLNLIGAYTIQKTLASPGLGAYYPTFWTVGPNPYTGRGRIGQVNSGFGNWGTTKYQDPDNRRMDKTLAPDDIPQVFNLALTYDLPFGPGKWLGGRSTGMGRWLIQGWKISSNFNAQRGVPMTITGPGNGLTNRPNLIGDPSAGRDSKSRPEQIQQWFNPSAFEAGFGSDPKIIDIATNGSPQDKDKYDEFWRFGTAGLNLGSARSPGFWNADLALAKEINFSESKRLQ